MTLPVIVIGAGGHARVLVEALKRAAAEIVGCTDCNSAGQGRGLGIPLLGSDDAVVRFPSASVRLANGIGSTRDGRVRREVFERFRSQGYRFAEVVHPSAVIAADAVLGEGVQVMAGAVVQPGCRIGVNAIINTRASVDHDCIIGDHVHIAPGAVLAGSVTVGTGAHVGTGATVIQGIAIGAAAIVAAGAVVTDDVAAATTVGGVPARPLSSVKSRR